MTSRERHRKPMSLARRCVQWVLVSALVALGLCGGCVRGSEFMASLPSGGDRASVIARERALLDAAERIVLPIEWAPVQVACGDGRTATVQLGRDVLRWGEPGANANPDDWDWVRIAVTAFTAQQLADKLGFVLPTAKASDLAWDHAHVVLTPHTQNPVTATTQAMLAHHAAIEAERAGREGLLSTVGKDWILGAKLFPANHPAHPLGKTGAINYGWHVRGQARQGGPYLGHGGRVQWQTEGYRHDLAHVDYSQWAPRAVGPWVEFDDGTRIATATLLTTPGVADVLSYEGALGGARYPNVPFPGASPSSNGMTLVSTVPSAQPSTKGRGIALVGDSMGEGIGPALAVLARRLGVPFWGRAKRSTRVADWDSDTMLAPAMSPLPALVVVCLGTNDERSANPTAAGERAGELIDRILAAGCRVAWVAPPRLPFPDGGFLAALADVCGMRGVPVLDSRALDLQKARDGIHCTQQGYRDWAAAIAAWLPLSAYASGGTVGPSTPVLAATPAPALTVLLRQIDAAWPDRARASDGIMGDLAHQARTSDHNDGDALDVTVDTAHGPDPEQLCRAVLRDARCRYVIYKRRIASPEKDGGAWRLYTGLSPHTDHVHISIYPDRRDDASLWDLSDVGGAAAQPQEPLAGVALPAPRPLAPGEGRYPVDYSAPLGERAAAFALDEERAGVREGPRVTQYRRGMGHAGEPWSAAAFCFAAYATLRPGEQLPHVYSPYVARIVASEVFRPLDQGYAPRVGDGAVWSYRGDPRQGGQGRIGRLLTTPVGDLGTFTAIEGDAGGGWQTREHHVGEPTLIGWVSYPLGRVTAPSLPQDVVVAGFGRLGLEDYVARVVTGELGASRDPAALQAQALAARSYVVWFVTNKGYGTDTKPIPNGQNFQVCARVAFPHCAKAADSTAGGLVLHRGRVVLTSYVAGALWPVGKVPSPAAARSAPDPTGTEKWVTYNDGHAGRSVVPSPIAGLSVPDNRGCMSQNGAVALAKLGYSWAQILRFFYGADATFSVAEPASLARPNTPPAGPTLVTPRPASPVGPSDGGGLLALSAALTIYRMVSS